MERELGVSRTQLATECSRWQLRGPSGRVPAGEARLDPKGAGRDRRRWTEGNLRVERLLSRAAEGPDLRLDVRLFDPTRTPGAGPNYDPALPKYLRMNFAAEQIDMWPTGAPRGESFQDWRDHDGDETGTDPYPPRAQVGRYLSDGLMGLLDDPGRRIEIGHARWRRRADSRRSRMSTSTVSAISRSMRCCSRPGTCRGSPSNRSGGGWHPRRSSPDEVVGVHGSRADLHRCRARADRRKGRFVFGRSTIRFASGTYQPVDPVGAILDPHRGRAVRCSPSLTRRWASPQEELERIAMGGAAGGSLAIEGTGELPRGGGCRLSPAVVGASLIAAVGARPDGSVDPEAMAREAAASGARRSSRACPRTRSGGAVARSGRRRSHRRIFAVGTRSCVARALSGNRGALSGEGLARGRNGRPSSFLSARARAGGLRAGAGQRGQAAGARRRGPGRLGMASRTSLASGGRGPVCRTTSSSTPCSPARE